ncbi:HNH endonuclease signature motif containing protein [Actinoallomurus purpureus]|uniref:HNH endonuclease signature motif containing protein n=1 Tax=Actinoallomurus purpureus TaxID=478114 RepID=UPI0035572614
MLEVDHIDQLADGGRDHPIQMIALCPDCHAVKTRGRTRHRLTPCWRGQRASCMTGGTPPRCDRLTTDCSRQAARRRDVAAPPARPRVRGERPAPGQARLLRRPRQ